MKPTIQDYFTYHRPKTEARIQKHKLVNEIALLLAETIDENVTDIKCKEMAIFAVQQARMFANQGITIDEISS